MTFDLDDVTEKELLAAILAELQAQRHGDPGQERYRCTFGDCGAVVGPDERDAHLRDEHGAPAGISTEKDFERAEE